MLYNIYMCSSLLAADLFSLIKGLVIKVQVNICFGLHLKHGWFMMQMSHRPPVIWIKLLVSRRCVHWTTKGVQIYQRIQHDEPISFEAPLRSIMLPNQWFRLFCWLCCSWSALKAQTMPRLQTPVGGIYLPSVRKLRFYFHEPSSV